MKKNVIKTAFAAVCVVAAGVSGMKAYNVANQSQADLLLAENIEAFSTESESESEGSGSTTTGKGWKRTGATITTSGNAVGYEEVCSWVSGGTSTCTINEKRYNFS